MSHALLVGPERPSQAKSERGLEALRAFVAREGHARVPRLHRENGFLLGRWVGDQRKAFKQGLLTPDQERQLEDFPGWVWFVRIVGAPLTFDEAARLSQDYAREHGHMRIPKDLVVEGRRLGEWVQNQRALYRRGKLCEEGVQILESLPGWSWGPRQDDFDHGLAVLRRFVDREKTARVPFDHVEDGFALGRWVRRRRRLRIEGYRHAGRERVLESLPDWTWEPYVHGFDKGLAMLRSFVRREGHARVPGRHVEHGFPLGGWVSHRRQQYRAGRLAQERVAQLEAFPGWLWTATPGPQPRKNAIAGDPPTSAPRSAR